MNLKPTILEVFSSDEFGQLAVTRKVLQDEGVIRKEVDVMLSARLHEDVISHEEVINLFLTDNETRSLIDKLSSALDRNDKAKEES